MQALDLSRAGVRFPFRVTDQETATRWVFAAICVYLASHAFTIPLVPIGPWPLWPTLPDLAFGLLVLAWFAAPRTSAAPFAIRRGQLAFVVVVLGSALSYVVQTVLLTNADSIVFGGGSGFQTGAFQLARMIEFAIVFLIASRVPFSADRIRTLGIVAFCVFLAVSALIVLTYLRVVPTSTFALHLPGGAAAGPWQGYRAFSQQEGLGAVGYNHAYVAAQVTLLFGFCLLLRPRLSTNWLVALAGISSFAVLLSGSRAGLLAHLLLVVAILSWRALPLFCFVGAAIVAIFLLGQVINPAPPTGQSPPSAVGTDPDENTTIAQRQRSAFLFFQSSNLSGRDRIWQGKLAALNEQPIRWIFGWGLGSAGEHGPGASAHMMALQIVVELGLIGFAVISVIVIKLLRALWMFGTETRSAFFVVGALLLSTVSQETLYPVAAQGQFLGLFALYIAVALRIGVQSNHTSEEPERSPRLAAAPSWRAGAAAS